MTTSRFLRVSPGVTSGDISIYPGIFVFVFLFLVVQTASAAPLDSKRTQEREIRGNGMLLVSIETQLKGALDKLKDFYQLSFEPSAESVHIYSRHWEHDESYPEFISNPARNTDLINTYPEFS